MFSLSSSWIAAFPTAHAGVLVLHNVTNPPAHPELERRKQALEEQLRRRFTGQTRRDLEALPTLQAYEIYYKRFKKTYHVQLQLESIAFKGKPIPSVAALVEAMFMAEVQNQLLTAGHDLDQLRLPVAVECAQGAESYTLLRGTLQVVKPGDMMMVDGNGIISSILYGPDQRTQIQPATRHVMFTVYAPPGIPAEAVTAHLHDIEQYVRLFAPEAKVALLEVLGGSQ